MPEPVGNARCGNPVPAGTGDLGRSLLVAIDEWADRGIAPSAEGFVRAVVNAVAELVKARFLLPHDAERYVAAAKETQVLK
ncbi:MAG: hypothetical protein GEU82_18800 [Luteitalea sp.]|nr:hypothetical protein [Luteitalea sp.]